MRFRVTIAALAAVVASLATSQAAAAPGPAEVPLAARAVLLAPAPARPAPKPKPRGFLVARLRSAVGVTGRPGGPVLGRFAPRTEFGSPRVLSVARVRGAWLGIVSPASTNGSLAWVRRDSRALRLGRVATALRADL